ARIAADAGIDVDRHAPPVAGVFVVGIQRDRARRRLLTLVDRARVLYELVARQCPDHAAAVHQVVILGAREGEVAARLDDLEPFAELGRIGGPDRVRIEAGADRELAAARTAVAEMHRGAAVRMTGDLEQRPADRAAAVSELDDVGDDLAVLT